MRKLCLILLVVCVVSIGWGWPKDYVEVTNKVEFYKQYIGWKLTIVAKERSGVRLEGHLVQIQHVESTNQDYLVLCTSGSQDNLALVAIEDVLYFRADKNSMT